MKLADHQMTNSVSRRKQSPLMQASFELVDETDFDAAKLKSSVRNALADGDVNVESTSKAAKSSKESVTNAKSRKAGMQFDDSDLQ